MKINDNGITRDMTPEEIAQYQAMKSQQITSSYKDKVVEMIREKYDANDVEALYANYLAEPNNEKYIAEFNEFQAYRIECKAKAKSEI